MQLDTRISTHLVKAYMIRYAGRNITECGLSSQTIEQKSDYNNNVIFQKDFVGII